MIRTILKDQTPQFRAYLGRYLKQKRQGLELSLKDVATEIGKTEASYRSLESGRANTTYETLSRLFVVLNLDLQDLYEISTISKVACANAIAKELSQDYPQ